MTPTTSYLATRRLALDREWEDISDTHPLSFLLSQYERRTYWFEAVETIRRLALSGFIVVSPRVGHRSVATAHLPPPNTSQMFGAGTVSQSVIAVFICIFSIKVFSFYGATPHRVRLSQPAT